MTIAPVLSTEQKKATISENTESKLKRNTNLKINLWGEKMKQNKLYLIAAVLLLFVTSIVAGPKTAEREVIEESYLAGISSGNQGLKVSSTYFLGEMKSSKAVIPLMRILREDNCDGARLAAALALIKIGDARGVFMVKRTVDFNDCAKVRKMAKHLYSAYVIGGEDAAEEDVNFALASL